MFLINLRSQSQQQQYPADELAWLATSAFNHAVDMFCANDRDGARLWVEHALNLAMATEGGDRELHEALQGKWLRMQSMLAT